MKNWRLNNINQSAFEKTGPVPRSITKTFEKFKKEQCQLAIETILEIESDLTTMFEEDQVDDS